MKRKLITLMVSTMLVATMAAGCGDTKSSNGTESATTTNEATEESTETSTETVIATEETQLDEDLDEDVTKKSSSTDKTSDQTVDDNTETTTKSSGAENTSKTKNTTSGSKPGSTETAKTGSGTTNTSIPVHTHNWVEVTEMVTITDSPATTTQELVTPESWEWVTDKTYKDLYCEQHNMTYAQFEAQFPGDDIWLIQIVYDGYMPTSSDDLADYIMTYVDKHPDYNDGLLNWTTVPADGEVEGHEVHHDAVYETVEVPAVTHTETIVTGYQCSTCGATK